MNPSSAEASSLPVVKDLVAHQKGSNINKSQKNQEQPKLPKNDKPTVEISFQEKFRLRLSLMVIHIFARNRIAVIVNRLKGKSTEEFINSTLTTIDNKESDFYDGLHRIIDEKQSELSNGYMTQDTLDRVMELFKNVNLKERTPGQHEKLRNKILNNLILSGISYRPE